MSDDELLDPFGETALQATSRRRKAVALSRVAAVLFWVLVIALVGARAVFQN